MNTARQILFRLIDDAPDEILPNVIDYVAFIKNKKSNQAHKELEEASLSSTDFWDNPVDDEVWNNV